MSVFRKFWNLLAEEGVWAALVRAANYAIPDKVFTAHRGYLVRNDLAVLAPYEGTEVVRWATLDDLVELRRFDDYCEDLPGWIARGDCFVVALRDGQIVGFENYQAKLHWLGSAARIGVNLDDDELWAVYSLVDPEYRRRGIVTDIMRFAGQEMREKGFRYVYGHIADGDRAAKKAHGNRGFVPIDSWRSFRILGMTYFRTNLIRLTGWWTPALSLKVRVRDVSSAKAGSDMAFAVSK